PRDLETICLKCLEKDPSRRYATAEGLADDLRRFLEGHPILARPASAWDLGWKWAKRRPSSAAALITAIAAICLLLGGTAYHIAQLRVAVHSAQTAREAADRNARAALEQRNLTLKALDQLVFSVQEKLGDTPATRSVRRALLDTAIAGLDE